MNCKMAVKVGQTVHAPDKRVLNWALPAKECLLTRTRRRALSAVAPALWNILSSVFRMTLIFLASCMVLKIWLYAPNM